MYKLGINFDEISDDLDISIKTMLDHMIRYGELRTVNQKNFVFWNDAEVKNFKSKINESGIELVAAATPLFKWYDKEDDPEVKHDSFGFNPRLSFEEKKKTIDRAISITNELKIPRLRIFSGLGVSKNAGKTFANSDLLYYSLDLADKYNIDLYLENEPVCKVNTKDEMVSLLSHNNSKRLKLWLDIANSIEIGEDIDSKFLKTVVSRLGYIHIKDFVLEDNRKTYVPAGDGVINYSKIIKDIYSVKPRDIVVTVETHATNNKIESSVASIMGTRKILKSLGVDYE